MTLPMTGSPTADHIHLIGIGGTMMANLAALLRQSGRTVTGSDVGVYPPASTLLAEAGIPVREGYHPDNLTPRPDLVVVGNAIPRGNPELEHALDTGIPYTSLPEAIRLALLPGRRSLVCTGTHGKTTTASLAAWTLEALGQHPSFLIGGRPANFGRGHQLAPGQWFVLEGDEYDTAYFDKAPKFFHYRPQVLLINTIEYDHADIYPDLASILLQFRRLVNIVPRSGFLAWHGDCPHATEVSARRLCPGASFGLGTGHDWRAEAIRTDGEWTRFTVRRQGEPLGSAALGVHGDFNVLNALAVCAALDHLGFPWPETRDALAGFRGVARRMTLCGQAGGIRVFDDFAHHPTAIALVLQATRRRFPAARLWAVFEPRSWTCRLDTHQNRMTDALAEADAVVLAEVFQSDRVPDGRRYDPHRTTAELAERGRMVRVCPDPPAIADFLGAAVQPGDVVVIMSNGGFGGLPDILMEKIRERYPPQPGD